jgi:hypothetical protein
MILLLIACSTEQFECILTHCSHNKWQSLSYSLQNRPHTMALRTLQSMLSASCHLHGLPLAWTVLKSPACVAMLTHLQPQIAVVAPAICTPGGHAHCLKKARAHTSGAHTHCLCELRTHLEQTHIGKRESDRGGSNPLNGTDTHDCGGCKHPVRT